MNRKDRQRMDERRRESHGHKDLSNQPHVQKSLMDSYFQSQQVIQSLSMKPGATETDDSKTPEISKSFRIPRKQTQPEKRTKSGDFDRSRSSSATNDRTHNDRNSYKNKRPRVDSPPRRVPSKIKQINTPGKQIARNDRENDKQREQSTSGRESEKFKAPSKPTPKIKTVEAPQKQNDKNGRENEKLEGESKKYVENEPIKEEPKSGNENGKLTETPIDTTRKSWIPEESYDFREIQPVQVFVRDRSNPGGKVLRENISILIQRLADMVKGTMVSGNGTFPRFLGCSGENGEVSVVCLNSYTSRYLQMKIPKMRQPWPNSDLECIIKPYTESVVTVVVPKSICHISEFIDLCKKGNKNLKTEKWRRVDHEECSDGSGRLFTLAMDPESYAIIQAEAGVVRCGDKKLEVRLKSS